MWTHIIINMKTSMLELCDFHIAIFLKYASKRDVDLFYGNVSKWPALKFFLTHSSPSISSLALLHCIELQHFP